jgi:biliverdin reductase
VADAGIRVGLVGTGYAAKLRAETLQADDRAHLVAVSGHTWESTSGFSQLYNAEAMPTWQTLIDRPEIDLVIIATVNRDHGAIAQAALQANKHVVVEYPLSLDLVEAQGLQALAIERHKLLHVEHIELLSGIHSAIQQSIEAIGTPFYGRYSSINPQHPAPQKWTYQPQLFGFPLVGAVSRIHRLTNLFGAVKTVSCQARFWSATRDYYSACLCTAQLSFTSGLIAEVIYGKGEAFWQAERDLMIQGSQGALVIAGEAGQLIRDGETRSLDIGSRRGLFARDTTLVLDHLTQGTALYVTLSESIQALAVADAARRSAELGQTIEL